MQERKVVLTYEAIYDVVEAEEYIRGRFGKNRSLEYREEIYAELKSLSTDAEMYASSGFMYRNYNIHKKPFPPAIIFWVIQEEEVHVLRVPREEMDWQRFFRENSDYEYTYPSIESK